MADDTLSVTAVVNAPPEAVFDVLADPATHSAIDGTGWVCESLDAERLTEPDQIFRMAMYHPNHPNGHYEMANRIVVLDRPSAISWEPGYDEAGDGNLQFGGWVWRYDLTLAGRSETEVTLTYDWSAVPQFIREYIQFPPFSPDHLRRSLQHLAELSTSTHRPGGDRSPA